MTYKLKTYSKRLLADTITPVNIYLKLRDVFAGSILLESSDYHGNENSLSFICCEPLATFKVVDQRAEIHYPGNEVQKIELSKANKVAELLEKFRNSFCPDTTVNAKYPHDGLFGYMAYDAVRYFEDLELQKTEAGLPDLIYSVYRYVIVVDHFFNELTLFEHRLDEGKESL
ncbi:MAG TPA: anthranilate synthase component I family protein, partial [Cyclobacteriaceae bacterium]|nr:anthranilate synthase component I family protein [Cyclobacteriaceae bacterium]